MKACSTVSTAADKKKKKLHAAGKEGGGWRSSQEPFQWSGHKEHMEVMGRIGVLNDLG